MKQKNRESELRIRLHFIGGLAIAGALFFGICIAVIWIVMVVVDLVSRPLRRDPNAHLRLPTK